MADDKAAKRGSVRVGEAPAAAAAEDSDSDTSSSSDSEGPERSRRHVPGSVTKIIKIGVMGDGTVGKTTFLLSYITQGFVTDYTPTVFDNFSAIEEVGGDIINVILWDLAGQDEYSAVRTTCYTSCNYDVVLLCFSVAHRDSFDNIKFKWQEELKPILTGTPFLLVGTKTDLRPANFTEGPAFVSRKEGEKRAKEMKAHKYVECSARDHPTVVAMVREAISIITTRDQLRKEKIFKQYKKEKKAEDKLEAKLAKARAKEEQRAREAAAAAAAKEAKEGKDHASAPAAAAPTAL